MLLMRRAIVALVVMSAAVGCSSGRRGEPQASPRDEATQGAHHVQDASGLNLTAVAEVVDIEGDSAAAEQQLARLLNRAHREQLKIAVAGTRHTMGGHTIYPGGIAINMRPFRSMRLLPGDSILHVQAGATWAEIIPFLDARGRSISVMQSNNSFSVGGSLSANAHGWQHNAPPIGSSVRALRVLLSNGAVVSCSRTRNAELFSLVLGGYGLFGIILDAELRTVPNQRYRADRYIVPTRDYVAAYAEHVDGSTDAAMVYGRLSVDPRSFLEEAILTVFRHRPARSGRVPPLKEPIFVPITRAIFRRSVGSDRGKAQRWWIEKHVSGLSGLTAFSRNQLLNTSVEVYENQSESSTDILHEYFVPPEQVAAFVDELRRIVRHHGTDLLNVTLRNVYPDPDSFLRYARREMFGLVILFNQPRTGDADRAMEAMTRELIDAALELGGTYYLPYRLHATQEQFRRAYPQAAEFFALKLKYDPAEIFQNQFYLAYGREHP